MAGLRELRSSLLLLYGLALLGGCASSPVVDDDDDTAADDDDDDSLSPDRLVADLGQEGCGSAGPGGIWLSEEGFAELPAPALWSAPVGELGGAFYFLAPLPEGARDACLIRAGHPGLLMARVEPFGTDESGANTARLSFGLDLADRLAAPLSLDLWGEAGWVPLATLGGNADQRWGRTQVSIEPGQLQAVDLDGGGPEPAVFLFRLGAAPDWVPVDLPLDRAELSEGEIDTLGPEPAVWPVVGSRALQPGADRSWPGRVGPHFVHGALLRRFYASGEARVQGSAPGDSWQLLETLGLGGYLALPDADLRGPWQVLEGEAEGAVAVQPGPDDHLWQAEQRDLWVALGVGEAADETALREEGHWLGSESAARGLPGTLAAATAGGVSGAGLLAAPAFDRGRQRVPPAHGRALLAAARAAAPEQLIWGQLAGDWPRSAWGWVSAEVDVLLLAHVPGREGGTVADDLLRQRALYRAGREAVAPGALWMASLASTPALQWGEEATFLLENEGRHYRADELRAQAGVALASGAQGLIWAGLPHPGEGRVDGVDIDRTPGIAVTHEVIHEVGGWLDEEPGLRPWLAAPEGPVERDGALERISLGEWDGADDLPWVVLRWAGELRLVLWSLADAERTATVHVLDTALEGPVRWSWPAGLIEEGPVQDAALRIPPGELVVLAWAPGG